MSRMYSAYNNLFGHNSILLMSEPPDPTGGSFHISWYVILSAAAAILAAYIIFKLLLEKKVEEWKRSVDSILGPVPMLPELEESDGNYKSFRSFELILDKERVEKAKRSKGLEPLLMDERILNYFTEKTQFFLVYKLDEKEILKEISSFPAWLGKGESADVLIEGDKNIDKRHGLIYIKDERYYYADANSMSGSIVDGKIDVEVAEIKNKTIIQMAGTELRVIINYDAES